MNIKGTSLTSTYNFVKLNYTSRFDEWLQKLPEDSRKLFSGIILAGGWYPISDGMIIPTKLIAKMFFDGDDKKAAYRIGEHSAVEGLNGVYRMFLKIASPSFVIKKSASILKTYYQDIVAEMIESNENSGIIHIKGFKEDEKLIFDRISAWVFKIFEIIKANPSEVKYIIIPTLDNNVEAKISLKWHKK